MGWGKILGAIAGIAGAPFTGGASLMLTAASLGSDLAGAAIAAHASGQAAKTQSASADKALALQRQVYQDQQRYQSPYMQLGQNSLQQLGAMAGRYGQPGGIPPMGPAGIPPGAGGPPPPSMMRRGGPQQSQPDGATQQPSGQQPLWRTAGQMDGSGQMAGSQSGGQQPLWTIQAPTGETKQVPAAIGQQYVAKGAKRIA